MSPVLPPARLTWLRNALAGGLSALDLTTPRATYVMRSLLAAGQALHVTNQSLILRSSEAHSRLIGLYMLFYAVGSGLGAIATTWTYARAVGAGCADWARQSADWRWRSGR